MDRTNLRRLGYATASGALTYAVVNGVFGTHIEALEAAVHVGGGVFVSLLIRDNEFGIMRRDDGQLVMPARDYKLVQQPDGGSAIALRD